MFSWNKIGPDKCVNTPTINLNVILYSGDFALYLELDNMPTP